MDIVCDSCSAQLRLPPDRVGDRGAKLKCPSCGVTLVIFPEEDVAMAVDAEPTTEDWSSMPLQQGEPPRSVPAAIKQLFDGEAVHPPGTVPPVQRAAQPLPPQFGAPTGGPDAKLSVTPPPPRAARAPLTPTASVLRSARPVEPARALDGDAPYGLGPPTEEPAHERVTEPHTMGPSAMRPDVARTPSPPVEKPSERRTQPPAPRTNPGLRARAGHPSPISAQTSPQTQRETPGSRNRTGPTGGASPQRSTASAWNQDLGPPMSYRPPWGESWGTDKPQQALPGPTPDGYAHGYANGFAHGVSATTPNPPPHQPVSGTTPLPPGAYPPPMYGTATPAPNAMVMTGTPAPVAGTNGMPVYATWQPAWMPAIMLGMERTTFVLLMSCVLVVGFGGACLGVGSSRLMPWNDVQFAGPQVSPDARRPMPVAPRPISADGAPLPSRTTAVGPTETPATPE